MSILTNQAILIFKKISKLPFSNKRTTSQSSELHRKQHHNHQNFIENNITVTRTSSRKHHNHQNFIENNITITRTSSRTASQSPELHREQHHNHQNFIENNITITRTSLIRRYVCIRVYIIFKAEKDLLALALKASALDKTTFLHDFYFI